MKSKRFTDVVERLDHHTQEMIGGASVAFILKMAAAALSFGFHLLLARMLGADGAGIYLLALTVANVSVIFSRFGLGRTLLRFIAAQQAVGQWTAVKGIYQLGLRLATMASIVVTAIVWLSARWIADAVFSEPDLYLCVGWLLAFCP